MSSLFTNRHRLRRRFFARQVFVLSKGLLIALLAIYFAFGLALLTLRWYVLPQANQARPWLEQQASTALNTQVLIQRVDADWRGLNPRLQLTGVELRNQQGAVQLSLPTVSATLSWMSLLRLSPQFSRLSVIAPELEVRRLSAQRFLIAGFELNLERLEDNAAVNTRGPLDWLLEQGEIRIRSARIDYEDTQAAAPIAAAITTPTTTPTATSTVALASASSPPAAQLALEDVDFTLRNGFRSHRFAVAATPPAELASRFDVRGEFTQRLFYRPADTRGWSGRLFIELGFVDLARVKPWIGELPKGMALMQAQGALRAWLDFDRQQIEAMVADLAMTDVALRLAAELEPLRFESLQSRFAQRLWRSGRQQGQEFELKGFTAVGRPNDASQAAALSWAPTDLRLRFTEARPQQPTSVQLEASSVHLDTLSALARQLPLPRPWREQLAQVQADGELRQLQLSFDLGDNGNALPAHYQLRTYFDQLSWRVPAVTNNATTQAAWLTKIPGFENLSGHLELNEANGSLSLQARNAVISLPTVFDEPELRFAQLTTALRWRHQGGASPELHVESFAARNQDLDINGSGTWRRGGRGAGLIDMQARINHLQAAATYRYLPTVLKAQTRAWLQHALLGGSGRDGQIRLRGDLADFPFNHTAHDIGGVDKSKSGEFRLSLPLQQAVLDIAPRDLPQEDGQIRDPWPLFEEIRGELVIDRSRLTVNARQARVFGVMIQPTQISIAELATRDPILKVKGSAVGPLADFLRYIQESPLDRILRGLLQTPSAKGDARLELALEIPLAHARDTQVTGALALAANDLQLRKEIPAFTRVNGRIEFGARHLRINNLTASFLGGQTRVDAERRSDSSLVFSAAGSATPQGVRPAVELGLVQRLLDTAQGSTRYNASLIIRDSRPTLTVDSDLAGWSINAPAPLNKNANDPLPLQVVWQPRVVTAARNDAAAERESDSIRVQAGKLLDVQLERQRRVESSAAKMQGADEASWRLERGLVSISRNKERSALPTSGLTVAIDLPRLEVDRWWPLLEAAPPAAEATLADRSRSTSNDSAALPDRLLLSVRELVVMGRSVNRLSLQATRAANGTWQGDLDAEQAAGAVSWAPASASANGSSARVIARLKRLHISPSAASDSAAPSPPAADSSLKELPALDLSAEQFTLGDRALGKLALVATSSGRAPQQQWLLQQIELTNADGRLSGSGRWTSDATQETSALSKTAINTASNSHKVALNLVLDFNNAGALLTRLGLPNAIKGGEGRLEADLHWRGSPLSLDLPSLSGGLTLAARKGQFLKADAGAGRLLGVLSLQALPRRITLDFRDVFSEGFAFDTVAATASLNNGVLQTSDLKMRGANATALIEGSVNLRAETQNLHVLVLPEVNATSASLMYALIANPAIGLGTFLAQMLLRDPLSRAFSFEYDVTGSWSDPQVKRRQVATTVPAPVESSN